MSEGTQATQDRIDLLSEELKKPIPTPPVGFPVVWYRRAQVSDGAEIAAIVTKVEDSGKITLTAFPPQGMPDPTRRGVLHVSNAIHDKRANSVSANCGSWDYPKGVTIPKSHFAHHKDKLERQIANLKADLQQALTIKEKQDKPAVADSKS